jgi:hypothetical protein
MEPETEGAIAAVRESMPQQQRGAIKPFRPATEHVFTFRDFVGKTYLQIRYS